MAFAESAARSRRTSLASPALYSSMSEQKMPLDEMSPLTWISRSTKTCAVPSMRVSIAYMRARAM